MPELIDASLPRIDFGQLVREHQSVVMGLGQSMGLRGVELEDATAEAFAAVFRALPGFRREAALGTWVYRIAWRTILKTRRNRKAGVAGESAAEPSTNATPGDDAEISETSRLLWSAVQSLDPMQAAAVELYYRRDWPVQSIADVLDCPAGTVKTLLHRARARLREVLTRLEVYP